MQEAKSEIISRLREDLLRWEGVKPPVSGEDTRMGLGQLEEAFPNGTFPAKTIHEFVSLKQETAAATCGFISGLLCKLTEGGGVCVWVSTRMMIHPPALKTFTTHPERIIFVSVKREKEALWVLEEALKCTGLSVVVAELNTLTFTQSRRLQLAVEKSRVTGLILRTDQEKIQATASHARWRVRPVSSFTDDGLPGVGHPAWQVELLKVRNGNPCSEEIRWKNGSFLPQPERSLPKFTHLKKVG